MNVRSKTLSSIKNRTMYKPVHRLLNQVNVLVSTRRGFLLKSACGQTLLTYYYVDFIVDLMLVFRVIICQFVFVSMSTFAYNFGTYV